MVSWLTDPPKTSDASDQWNIGPAAPTSAAEIVARSTPIKGWVMRIHLPNKECDIKGEDGSLYKNVPFPQSISNPNTGAGEFTIPREGTQVLIHNRFTEARCEIDVPVFSAHEDPEDAPNILPSTTSNDSIGDPSTSSNGSITRIGPQDMKPGDWARIGEHGQAIGLVGNKAILKGGALSQVICDQGADLVQTVGQNIDLLSGFGHLKFSKDRNGTSMQLKGGANYTEDSGPTLEKYTIHADLGRGGDLVDFKITTPDQDTKSSVKYYPTGAVATTSKSRTDAIDGNETRVVTGTRITEVNSDYLHSKNGYTLVSSKQISVNGGKIAFGTGGSCTMNGGNVGIHAGGALRLSASGDTAATPLSVAYNTSVTNGSMVIEIGNPAAGDTGSGMSSFEVKTHTLGNITLSQLGAGNIELKTTKPADSVLLGGQVGIYHAVLYEMLEAYLQQLNVYLDTHTHPTGVGPSGPPLLPTSSQAFPANMPLLKSMIVTIGG
jgi:hypothetical protein